MKYAICSEKTVNLSENFTNRSSEMTFYRKFIAVFGE